MSILVEIDAVVPLKKSFKFCQFLFAFPLLFPLGEKGGPLFDRNQILFTQGFFILYLVEICPVVLEREYFYLNVFSFCVII